MHAIRAERIDGNRQRQRRVDAARKSHRDAGEAVLVDVVAHAQRERAIDAFLIAELRRDVAGDRNGDAAGVAIEFNQERALLEGRRALHDIGGGIHHEGVAVEDQLVLPADHVQVHERQLHIQHRVARDAFALPLLVQLIGRGVDHDEQFGAGIACAARRQRIPRCPRRSRMPTRNPLHSTTVACEPPVK